MKAIFILTVLFFSFGFGYSQVLTVSNNQTHTTSGNASYTGITLGNNSLLHVISPDSIYCSGNVSSNNGIGITIDAGAILHVVGSLTGNNNVELNISGKITFGSVDINNNGSLTILGSGEVNILENLTAGNGTVITIDPNSTLNINGDLTIDPTTSTVNVNGVINVGGEYDGPSFTGNGIVYENGVQIYPTTLPITLTSFTTTCDNIMPVLNWKTASEQNSDYFQIERSQNGFDWKIISQIPGAGNSNTDKNYQFYDMTAGRFEGYYRLKQVDYDGKFEYFGPVSSNCLESVNKLESEVFPNPTSSDIFIGMRHNQEEDVQILITDNSGRIILQDDIKLINGYVLKSVNLSTYQTGVYQIYIITSGHKYIHKIIKK